MTPSHSEPEGKQEFRGWLASSIHEYPWFQNDTGPFLSSPERIKLLPIRLLERYATGGGPCLGCADVAGGSLALLEVDPA